MALLSANDERDAGEVDGSRVVREELGESPGGQSSRSNRVRMSGGAKGEGDRQLVGPDGLRAVPVIPAAEVIAQPVVDHLAQLLKSMQDLPGRVATLATESDACAVPRPGGLGRGNVRVLRHGGGRPRSLGGRDTRERTIPRVLRRPRAVQAELADTGGG